MKFMAYFIGGPFDLTKRAITMPEPLVTVYEAAKTKPQIWRHKVGEVYIEKHEYRLVLRREVGNSAYQAGILIYEYVRSIY